jgi:hypothetical protein
MEAYLRERQPPMIKIPLKILVCAYFLQIGIGCANHKEESSQIKQSGWKSKSVQELHDTENVNLNARNALTHFINSLKSRDTDSFRKLVSNKGLVVIRNFVSGGFGARGKDIRSCYLPNQIPSNISFDVYGETPIDPAVLFKTVIEGNVDKIQIRTLQGLQFNLLDDCRKGQYAPATNIIYSDADSIIKSISIKDNSPTVVMLNSREMLLCIAQDINGLPIGCFALFECDAGACMLRGLMDFR